MGLVRTLIVVVLCVVLVVQAQRARGLRYRPWSMLFGAVAFGVLAITNVLSLVGVNISEYAVFAVGLPLALMVISVVLLVLSWRAGERQTDLRDARRTLADEIKRRQQ